MARKVIDTDHGWVVWSPFQGPFSWSIARTRAEAIKRFQDNAGGNWERWRRSGFKAVRVTIKAHRAYLPQPDQG